MKMNSKYKQPWIDALRSGEYEQGRKRLCANGGIYCCLGVLEEINKDALKTKINTDLISGLVTRSYDGHMALPSNKHTVEFFGIPDIPDVTINGVTTKLHYHNDNGATFEQIADAIEQQL